jgi:hypothetical protein
MRGASRIYHRNFNKRDIAAVVNEGSISAGWNPKNEPLCSRGCKDAGVGNNGTGLVIRDSAKLAWLPGENQNQNKNAVPISEFDACELRKAL